MELTPRCEVTAIHEEIVAQVRQKMPAAVKLLELADLFSVLGDGTRIRILCALFQAELCVCDIAHLLEMSQSAISHQLRLLKQAKLVRFRKEGRIVYYSLADDHVKTIFDQGFQHILEEDERK